MNSQNSQAGYCMNIKISCRNDTSLRQHVHSLESHLSFAIRDLIKHTQILPVIPWSSIPNLLTFFKGGISKVFSFPFKTRDRNQLPLALSFISPPSLLSSVDSSVRDTPETAFISYNCLAIGGHTILLRCIFTPFYLPSFLR